ncbi:MAG TPA: thiamine phosphate synthase [Usitatibacter sp.]|nr:thiamine phosphate synthase [Usitatibacter sp.]
MTSDSRFVLAGLYAITPVTADTQRLVERVVHALEGGAALVQYRAKALSAAIALEQARALARLCRAHGVPLIVNDSVELALASGADGVHVGRDDADPAAARAAMPHGIVGVSCYAAPDSARAAAAAGADYVAIGSLFASATKPGAARARLEHLGEARLAGGLPVAAIGGITAANVAQVAAAGADMAAVISALFDSPDVRAAARSLSGPFATAARRAHG